MMITWRRMSAALAMAALVALPPMSHAGAEVPAHLLAGGSDQPVFATPEEAVRALIDAVAASDMPRLLALLGPGSEDLAASSDPETGRRNREVFVVAIAEGWRLADRAPDAKELVVGNEDWPFPVPLVRDPRGWRFDTAAGREEVIDRRIGRNELGAIRVCATYVAAQRIYASRSHDGKPAGIYARRVRSDPGTENGLYWPATRGVHRSPLGELAASAADDAAARSTGAGGRIPFHGYYYRILDRQGAAAPGGAVEYVVDGEMTRGFGLIAWPSEYGGTGVMTFLVNRDGVVYEKDLGAGTTAAAAAIAGFDPDSTWQKTALETPR
jgi:hypothetical protein